MPGIIRSEYAFLAWHYLHGRKPLKAGEYAFDHRATAREVYDRIARGDIYFHTLVVPEGYNMFDIATAMEEAGLGKRDDFLKVARTDTALVRDLDPQAPSLEGYLFPDTYHFTRTQSLHDMAAVMVRRFRQAAKDVGLNQNVHDVVTMASIVEKETGAAEERPAVASVFYNRLDKHMVLATDPSVIYAALLNNRYNGTIHQSDLHFDSPYNTYRTRRAAAGADLQSGQGFIAGGAASGPDRLSVFRKRQSGSPSLCPHRFRTCYQRPGLPARGCTGRKPLKRLPVAAKCHSLPWLISHIRAPSFRYTKCIQLRV